MWVELRSAALASYIEMMSGERQLAVGLISGTSMDGIDACVLEITEEHQTDHQSAIAANMHQRLTLNLVGFLTQPYPDKLREELHHLCVAGSTAVVCMYNVLLGKMFAQAAQAVVGKCGLGMEDVTVIGSHGQTIHHLPAPQQLHGLSITSTLQIGDPSVIAQECGVTTVGDFRPADMAVGGQGAPLVPYLDRILLERHFSKKERIGMLLNIGGISNVSAFIPPCMDANSEDRRFIGFDCGPGNVLIDSLMKRWFGEDFDKDGKKAAEGQPSGQLLERLIMEDRYIKHPPPKSTGREHYDKHYISSIVGLCEELNISREDCIATLTEFTAATVLVNFELFIRPLVRTIGDKGGDYQDQTLCVCEWDLFVSGGGARNKTLMKTLEQRFEKYNVTVATTNMLGIDPDAKEAVCFALLAYQTIQGRATNVPGWDPHFRYIQRACMRGVTGARKEVVLGKICTVRAQKATS